MMAVDAAHFSSEFVATLIRDFPTSDYPPLESAERVFSKKDIISGKEEILGAFVSKAGNEYEYGEYLMVLYSPELGAMECSGVC